MHSSFSSAEEPRRFSASPRLQPVIEQVIEVHEMPRAVGSDGNRDHDSNHEERE
jgi:hypothetical protein